MKMPARPPIMSRLLASDRFHRLAAGDAVAANRAQFARDLAAGPPDAWGGVTNLDSK